MHDPVYDHKPDPPTPAELRERAEIVRKADQVAAHLIAVRSDISSRSLAEITVPATIFVWSFYDAPWELQKLSEHSGDEDWIVVMPSGHSALEWCHWLNCMSHGEEPSRYDLPCGAVVFIAAH